jgi:DNA modification methylase
VVAVSLDGAFARMVFTDPPYNVKIRGHVQGRGQIKHREFAFAAGEMTERQYISFLEAAFSKLIPHCTDGAIAFVCIDWRHIGELLRAARKIFSEYKNLVVWNKTSPGQGSFYRSQHELIGVFKVGTGDHRNSFGLGQHGRTRSNVWTYPGGNSFHAGRMDELAMHPTVKPVALVADALRDCSMRGEVVLDPFLGSGTTVLAAEKVGRQAFGLEIDPAYVDVAVRRWQSFTRADAVLAGGGRTFDEMAAERAGITTEASCGMRAAGRAVMRRRTHDGASQARRTEG